MDQSPRTCECCSQEQGEAEPLRGAVDRGRVYGRRGSWTNPSVTGATKMVGEAAGAVNAAATPRPSRSNQGQRLTSYWVNQFTEKREEEQPSR